MGWDGGSGKRFDHSQLSTRKGIIPENSSPEFSRQSPRNFVAPLILKSETNGNTGLVFRRRQSKFSNLLVCLSVPGQHHRLFPGFRGGSAYISAVYSTLAAAGGKDADLPAGCVWSPE